MQLKYCLLQTTIIILTFDAWTNLNGFASIANKAFSVIMLQGVKPLQSGCKIGFKKGSIKDPNMIKGAVNIYLYE